jgi:hypothetical protein
LRLHLSSLSLRHVNEDLSELDIPTNSKTTLFDFIEKYKDSPGDAPELETLYRKFKARYLGSKKIVLTFNQKYAYKHKTIEYVSAYHPLINAIIDYFAANGFDKNQAHKIALSSKHFLNGKSITPDYYVSSTEPGASLVHIPGNKGVLKAANLTGQSVLLSAAVQSSTN